MVTNIQSVLFGFTVACAVYFMIVKHDDDNDDNNDYWGFT